MDLSQFDDLRPGDRLLCEGEGDYIEEFTVIEISPDRRYVKIEYAGHDGAERDFEWLEIMDTRVLVKLGPRPAD